MSVADGTFREDVLLVFGGNQSRELFEPVEDDVDARGYRAGLASDHEKARAVTGHVVFFPEVRAIRNCINNV